MVLAPHKGAKTRVKAQESAAAPPAQRAAPAPAEPAQAPATPAEQAGGSAPGEAPTS
jgi:translation initiation factor IF-3